MKILSVFSLLLLFNSKPVAAQFGIIDTTFDIDGKISVSFGNDRDEARFITQLPDGNILVAGNSILIGHSIPAVLRLHSDGTLDSSFALAGKMLFEATGNPNCHGLFALPDGSFYITGSIYPDDNFDFFAARFLADGSPDLSFGTGGIAVADLDLDQTAFDGALQSDGKIIIAGYSFLGGSNFTEFVLTRFNADGSLDTDFGTGGFTYSDFGSNYDDCLGVVLQSDGKIFAAGNSYNTSGIHNIGLVRFNSDGSPDLSFGDAGYVMADFGLQQNYFSKIKAMPDGAIYLTATVYTGNDFELGIAKFSATGAPDETFNANGRLTADLTTEDMPSDLLIQPDGNIIVCGATGEPDAFDFFIYRCSATGLPDESFGNGGLTITDFGANDLASGMAFQSDGKIIVCGNSGVPAAGSGFFAMSRYNTGVIFIIPDPSPPIEKTMLAPNPVFSTLALHSAIEMTSVSIYNIHGDLMNEIPVSGYTDYIDMHLLHQGIYFIRIRSAEKDSEVLRVIKN